MHNFVDIPDKRGADNGGTVSVRVSAERRPLVKSDGRCRVFSFILFDFFCRFRRKTFVIQHITAPEKWIFWFLTIISHHFSKIHSFVAKKQTFIILDLKRQNGYNKNTMILKSQGVGI
jgi:hypothetical protein